jgi:hypothetical protein
MVAVPADGAGSLGANAAATSSTPPTSRYEPRMSVGQCFSATTRVTRCTASTTAVSTASRDRHAGWSRPITTAAMLQATATKTAAPEG